MLGLFFHILGMSSSQLTFTPSFFRGVGQPATRKVLKTHWVGLREYLKQNPWFFFPLSMGLTIQYGVFP